MGDMGNVSISSTCVVVREASGVTQALGVIICQFAPEKPVFKKDINLSQIT
jgi:hypothetical protein